MESIKIGEIIKQRVALSGMSKAELARRLCMSPANVHKIFKRTSLDAQLLRRISTILDYDFFQHFEPTVTRPPQGPVPHHDVNDTDVLFIRYIVDLQSRLQILEQHVETLKTLHPSTTPSPGTISSPQNPSSSAPAR